MPVEIQFNDKYQQESELHSKHFINLIHLVIKTEQLDCKSVSIIWLSDEKLRKMHKEYLNNPELTDVITFDLGEDQIEAEIYISVDRAIDHARQFSVTLENELNRLLAHGLLHLAGYDDHIKSDTKKMREREDFYLNQLNRF